MPKPVIGGVGMCGQRTRTPLTDLVRISARLTVVPAAFRGEPSYALADKPEIGTLATLLLPTMHGRRPLQGNKLIKPELRLGLADETSGNISMGAACAIHHANT